MTVPRRFSLRAMLVTLTLLALILAWYGARVRALQAERAFLSGTWQMIDDEGKPVVIAGKPVRFNFDDPSTVVMLPNDEIGKLDFFSTNWQGPSRAIYRREGKRLRFAQADANDERPTEFDKAKCHTLWLVERGK